MSSYKKRQKVLKRTHRERGQVHTRQHLGLLEKRKDYVLRAKDYHKKQDELKRMHEKARNRNPDEFYYKMVNTKLKGGRHITPQDLDKHTPQQLQLMNTQDEKYIQMKLTAETKKVQRLKSCLHHTDLMKNSPPNTRTIFVDSVEEVASYCEAHEDKAAVHEDKADIKQEGKGNKKRKKTQGLLYKELKQRVHRCKELERVASKMRTRKNVMGKGQKVKIKGDSDHPVTYKWKQERKK